MKHVILAISLVILTACEKPSMKGFINETTLAEPTVNAKPNIELGSSVDSIQSLAKWEKK